MGNITWLILIHGLYYHDYMVILSSAYIGLAGKLTHDYHPVHRHQYPWIFYLIHVFMLFLYYDCPWWKHRWLQVFREHYQLAVLVRPMSALWYLFCFLGIVITSVWWRAEINKKQYTFLYYLIYLATNNNKIYTNNYNGTYGSIQVYNILIHTFR